VYRGYRQQAITLDQAYTDEEALRTRLEELFTAKVHRLTVRKVDLVNDTTNVDVRYELLADGHDHGPTRSILGVGGGRRASR
jgi:hypothetical protein